VVAIAFRLAFNVPNGKTGRGIASCAQVKARIRTYGQAILHWDEYFCDVDAGSYSTGRMKREAMPNNDDPPNTHSPSAQGVGGR
jgi:hypothetical protein